MREARFQAKCIAYARTQGWLAFKWASPAHRGVPDALFLKGGKLVIIEFKSTEGTGRLSALQVKTIDDIESIGGFNVHVVQDFDYFKRILECLNG